MSPRTSPLENETCRQCTSFADYMKENKKKLQEKPENVSNMPQRRKDCPLDKDELGQGSWGLLHTMAAKYPDDPTCEERKDMKQFLQLFAKFYPCDHCAESLKEEIKSNPPKVKSQFALSLWLCKLHNKINVDLGKPEFDCNKVNERWRDGWSDGSCEN